ncbi:MAG: cbb3-type cytochrome oxidase assembly protein CcoS [Opitutaceae bacterium]|nr:cbb3-type cytochrome oxidase assembly protein CcoS [Opitutaceae bacterium]
MGYGSYIFVVVMAVAVMASAVYALYWAVKTGQFHQFEKGATAIFDDEEPLGRPTDHFPQKRKKGRTV